LSVLASGIKTKGPSWNGRVWKGGSTYLVIIEQLKQWILTNLITNTQKNFNLKVSEFMFTAWSASATGSDKIIYLSVLAPGIKTKGLSWNGSLERFWRQKKTAGCLDWAKFRH
jgi:hypothetical protein